MRKKRRAEYYYFLQFSRVSYTRSIRRKKKTNKRKAVCLLRIKIFLLRSAFVCCLMCFFVLYVKCSMSTVDLLIFTGLMYSSCMIFYDSISFRMPWMEHENISKHADAWCWHETFIKRKKKHSKTQTKTEFYFQYFILYFLLQREIRSHLWSIRYWYGWRAHKINFQIFFSKNR